MVGLAIAAVLGAGAAAYLFQPWKLWVDEVVAEPLPVVDTGAGRGVDAVAGRRDGQEEPVPLRELARGGFLSHEHATTGTARVLRLPDGSLVLRVEDLETSNGPALKVWLADAPVRPGRDGWFVFDDGEHVDLGDLKGNIGTQNYAIPPDADLDRLRSVSIWCDRFNVSFGAATLVPARQGA